MERELWTQLYRLAVMLDKRPTRGFYRGSEILGVYFWAVVHDRPTSWATEARNWPKDLLPRYFPSQSTISRRLRSRGVEQLLETMEEHLGEDPQKPWIKIIDGKPLPVGGNSKDPDAKFGRATGGVAKGYKFHAIWGVGPLPLIFVLAAMNLGEQTAARAMLPLLHGGGYLLGDKNYDSNSLYDGAACVGHQLLAPRRRSTGGLGHRRHSLYRLRAMELFGSPFGRELFRYRTHIERNFGWLTSFAAGLSPLPSWVRRPHRVRLWVRAKLLINAIRILNKAGIHVLAVA